MEIGLKGNWLGTNAHNSQATKLQKLVLHKAKYTFSKVNLILMVNL